MMKEEIQKEPAIKVPHTYVILFMVMIFITVLTYFIPAGEFARTLNETTNKEEVIAGSYHLVEQSPVSPFSMFKAIHKGMEQSAYIIFFVFLIGGTFGILQATGTIAAGIGTLVKKAQGNEALMIPLSMGIFALAGAVFGMAEEMLLFIPIYIALSLALGFDTITGVAVCWLGASSGFAAAFLNPFTVGIAQGIVGLPPFSGVLLRIVAFILIVSSGIYYVYRHANKVKNNPKLSPTYELDKMNIQKFHLGDVVVLNGRHKSILLLLLLGVSFIAYGVMELNYYITELSAVFVIIGVLAGVIGKLKFDEIAEEFVKGAAEMTYGALVIGIATAISVIMQEGKIMDTTIHALASTISDLPQNIAAVAMFTTQSFINLLIPSGSGQAAVTMPIMGPIAEIVGITKQTAVLAYQFGDGFTNTISPTHGVLMASIAVAGINWATWARWLLPLFVIWNLIAIVLLVIAVNINYGPF